MLESWADTLEMLNIDLLNTTQRNKDRLSLVKLMNRSDKIFYFYYYLFGWADVDYRFGTHKPKSIVLLMNIHPFINLKCNPDIFIFSQLTHKHTHTMVDSAFVQVGKNLSEAMRILENGHR